MLSGRHDDVEDVLQEAFRLAYKAENGKEIEQPKSFLFQIAKNVALNQLRQKSRRPTDYLEDSESADVLVSEWTLEDEVIAQQKLEIHCAAVAALPPQCRKVYLMRKVYAMSYKEIAEALEITVSTVESHMEKRLRALSRVRRSTHGGEGNSDQPYEEEAAGLIHGKRTPLPES